MAITTESKIGSLVRYTLTIPSSASGAGNAGTGTVVLPDAWELFKFEGIYTGDTAWAASQVLQLEVKAIGSFNTWGTVGIDDASEVPVAMFCVADRYVIPQDGRQIIIPNSGSTSFRVICTQSEAAEMTIQAIW